MHFILHKCHEMQVVLMDVCTMLPLAMTSLPLYQAEMIIIPTPSGMKGALYETLS